MLKVIALNYTIVFFFNDTATAKHYTYCLTLSLHDALPFESDETLTEAHAWLARRNAILVEMLDPPFERTHRDRIGADGERVRSLAPLLARAARREGRHHRAGGAELVRDIAMVDGSAAVVEQRPLY